MRWVIFKKNTRLGFSARLQLLFIVFLVSGICVKYLSAGSVQITYNVGPCEGNTEMSHTRTGQKATFHVFVEEISIQSRKFCEPNDPVDCDRD